jgi:MOSC domain-containing protein YiiM
MAEGIVRAVCVSKERVKPKRDVGRGELRADWGLVGDSHSGPPRPNRWQISLLAWEDVEALNETHGLDAVSGSFAENLTTEGLDTSTLHAGDRLEIGGGDEAVGGVVLEVEQLGKPAGIAHTYNYRGHSLLPTKGVFCAVVSGGTVRAGDRIRRLRRS